MSWPSKLLHSRFDCYDKRDRILLKTLLKEAVVGRFKKAQLRNLNRWRLYPLLAPFVESLEETHCVYACSLQEFAGRFFGIRNFGINNELISEFCYNWLRQVFTFQELKQQQVLPTKMVQTTWNIEGEKHVCDNNLAERHQEIRRCMLKGPTL